MSHDDQSNPPEALIFDPGIHDGQFAYLYQRPDIDFWLRLAKEFGPRVLELACGSGRITIPIAKAGIHIDGADFSDAMLRVARERAATQGVAIQWFRADIRKLELEPSYDLIFLPSGTLSHLLRRTDVELFLAGVRRALRPGGVLALDLHNPTASWLGQWPLDPTPKQSRFQHAQTGEPIDVTTRSDYQADQQRYTICNDYTFASGEQRRDITVLKTYFPLELEALLHYNHFSVIRTYGDYTQGPFQANAAKYIVLSQPNPQPLIPTDPK